MSEQDVIVIPWGWITQEMMADKVSRLAFKEPNRIWRVAHELLMEEFNNDALESLADDYGMDPETGLPYADDEEGVS